MGSGPEVREGAGTMPDGRTPVSGDMEGERGGLEGLRGQVGWSLNTSLWPGRGWGRGGPGSSPRTALAARGLHNFRRYGSPCAPTQSGAARGRAGTCPAHGCVSGSDLGLRRGQLLLAMQWSGPEPVLHQRAARVPALISWALPARPINMVAGHSQFPRILTSPAVTNTNSVTT